MGNEKKRRGSVKREREQDIFCLAIRVNRLEIYLPWLAHDPLQRDIHVEGAAKRPLDLACFPSIRIIPNDSDPIDISGMSKGEEEEKD